MIKTSILVSLSLVGSIAACGGSDSDPKLPTCPSGNCGQESFRRAVPTRAQVAIAHPTGKPQARAAFAKRPGVGRKGVVALEPVSAALIAVDDQVSEIDSVIDDVFADLESASGTTPEIETETEHLWRTSDAEQSGQDDLLRITTTDGVTFTVDYFVVPSGGAPAGDPIITGTVRSEENDTLNFELELDIDAFAAVDPTFVGTGSIVIAAMPLAGGKSEHWFDYQDVSFDGGPVETSRTTAWAYSESSVALEFVAVIDDEETTVYARWDERGGRYDHHLAFVDPDVGPVDEVATNCWDPSGAESFDAWVIIDQALNYYGELDGVESACTFGPVADHPTPGEDFDELPEDGEWDDLELLSWCDASDEC